MPSVISSSLNQLVVALWSPVEITAGLGPPFIGVQVSRNHGGVKIFAVEFGAYFFLPADGPLFRPYGIGLVDIKLDTSKSLSVLLNTPLTMPPIQLSPVARIYFAHDDSVTPTANPASYNHSDKYVHPITVPPETDSCFAMSVHPVAGVAGNILAWLLVRGEVLPVEEGKQEVEL